MLHALVPSLRRFEFEASLTYKVFSRAARTVVGPCLNAHPPPNVESSLSTIGVQPLVLGASERDTNIMRRTGKHLPL